MAKKSVIEIANEHPKTTFVIRVFLWTLFAAILPFAFIAWRYGIFTNEPKLQITGLGSVAAIIVIIFLITLIRYLYKGLNEGIYKQCVSGFASIILPLTVFYLLITSIEGNISLFKQALGCVILCETIAIPLNPFPSWLAKRNIEKGNKKIDTMADMLWDKFFEKKKEDK